MKAKFCRLTVLRKMFYFIILLIFRAIRRQSLSEIGFGRLDTYTKLDKLGEVNTHFTFYTSQSQHSLCLCCSVKLLERYCKTAILKYFNFIFLDL